MATATPTTAEKIETYFTHAPAFAQPICDKIRNAISQADPALKPSWKWNAPVYEKAGPGMVCAIGIFKKHVNLSFFQGALLLDQHGLFTSGQDAKALRRIKFTDVAQVPEALLVEYLQAAVKLPAGTAAKSTERDLLEIPEDLKAALQEGQQLEKFEQMAYTHRKEYLRWVQEARKQETRDSRILKTVERMAIGKKFC
ncbi:DUF1801 domain-containing protein [Rufibacter quisquiliarum]|uniref:Uncharacterized protein YdeI (YjbR/CyaY-like superfamily) n=1 Tax=Rufibacter quisquiliarum TaxID=1549639 RepID=A0A839GSW7_9BACT|nr:DUF1801 domain-containing protein [Rufibacter quisquiliarum]MBA9078575.1 uncharacterized protein YdeI (YjbR/CyaY-like superfamily) [Rufibacter quisquiliarum]